MNNEIIQSSTLKLAQRLKQYGLRIERLSYEDAKEEIYKNYDKIFNEQNNAHYKYSKEEVERSKAVRENYSQLHSDTFILRDENDNFIGHFMGEAEDYCTYYLRNAGLTPEYRRQKIASNFLAFFSVYLYDLGFSRVTSQHFGTNTPVLIMMLKAGFYIAGVETREEWGTLVKCVKLLEERREHFFKESLKSQALQKKVSNEDI